MKNNQHEAAMEVKIWKQILKYTMTDSEGEDGPDLVHHPQCSATRREPRDRASQNVVHSEVLWNRVNDPSAGSPTETLLRLLLPLSDKVH